MNSLPLFMVIVLTDNKDILGNNPEIDKVLLIHAKNEEEAKKNALYQTRSDAKISCLKLEQRDYGDGVSICELNTYLLLSLLPYILRNKLMEIDTKAGHPVRYGG